MRKKLPFPTTTDAQWGIFLKAFGLEGNKPQSKEEAREKARDIWKIIHNSRLRLDLLADKLPSLKASFNILRGLQTERAKARIIVQRICRNPSRTMLRHRGFRNVRSEMLIMLRTELQED